MATISKPNTFTAGTKIVASQVNSNFDIIYNDYNGNITNANLSAAAAIADSKLAAISTTGKVNATALTETSEAAGTVLGHNGTNWTSISSSTQRYKVLMSMGSTSAASFQKINLASAHSITGELAEANIAADVRCKGWVNFNGKTNTVQDSYNVTSVVTHGTGKHRINWTTPFANTSHAIVAMCNGPLVFGRIATIATVNAAYCTVWTSIHDGSAEAESIVCVMAFGDR